MLFFTLNIFFNEAQKTPYFLDFQDNHFSEQHKTHGIICVHYIVERNSC